MASERKNDDLPIESRLTDVLNDARCLNLNDDDNQKLFDLIDEYFDERTMSDDEELTAEEKVDFNDDHDEDGGGGLFSEEEEEDYDDEPGGINERNDADDGDESQDENIMVGNDIILSNGDPEFMSESDEKEMQNIKAKRCRCKNPHNGLGCTHKFSDEYVFKMRYQLRAFTRESKTLFLLGKIATSGVRAGASTNCSKQINKERKRKRTDMGYYIDGIKVCRDAFLFIHITSDKFLTKLTKNYIENGIELHESFAGGSKFNTRRFSTEDIERAITFLSKFAEEKALVIPGRIPGVKCSDPRIRLLPASENKTSVWRKYRKSLNELSAASGTEYRIMGRWSFVKAWKKYRPFILTTKPRSDLCWTCQKHNQKIYLSANASDARKTEIIQAQVEHLRVVELERKLYQEDTAKAKEAIRVSAGELGPHQACSREGVMHYSFDFAQQLFFPHDPEQPGPVYFMTARKCGVFGIHCEGLSNQINFLVDEGMDVGKGANTVISFLHFYLTHYSLGEEILHLHCDNCSGQNKNKYVMWYLLWRTLHGLHKEISVRFLVAGHTKFAPDWCFGLFKQRYNVSHSSCLQDVAEACRSSTQAEVNIPQLVGTESGDIIVPTYDWKAFFDGYFKPVTGIKSVHHLRFALNTPGVVFCKEFADSDEKMMKLLKDDDVVPPVELPQPITPLGLSMNRQWYLYKQIRQFCAQDHRADLTCPLPGGEEPSDQAA